MINQKENKQTNCEVKAACGCRAIACEFIGALFFSAVSIVPVGYFFQKRGFSLLPLPNFQGL